MKKVLWILVVLLLLIWGWFLLNKFDLLSNLWPEALKTSFFNHYFEWADNVEEGVDELVDITEVPVMNYWTSLYVEEVSALKIGAADEI